MCLFEPMANFEFSSTAYFPGSPRCCGNFLFISHSLRRRGGNKTAERRAAKRGDEPPRTAAALKTDPRTEREREIFANDDRASINLSALGAAYCFCHYKVERSKKIMNATEGTYYRERGLLGRVDRHLIRSFSTQSAKTIITWAHLVRRASFDMKNATRRIKCF